MTESKLQIKTPSEVLAEKILTLLAEKKLVLVEDVKRAIPNFANGKLSGADWRMLLEKGIEKRGAE